MYLSSAGLCSETSPERSKESTDAEHMMRTGAEQPKERTSASLNTLSEKIHCRRLKNNDDAGDEDDDADDAEARMTVMTMMLKRE